MLSPHHTRLALLPLLLLASTAVVGLAVVAFQQALAAGRAEVLMMAWVLAFVLGAPALLVLLPLAGRVPVRRSKDAVIPNAGEKIP